MIQSDWTNFINFLQQIFTLKIHANPKMFALKVTIFILIALMIMFLLVIILIYKADLPTTYREVQERKMGIYRNRKGKGQQRCNSGSETPRRSSEVGSRCSSAPAPTAVPITAPILPNVNSLPNCRSRSSLFCYGTAQNPRSTVNAMVSNNVSPNLRLKSQTNIRDRHVSEDSHGLVLAPCKMSQKSIEFWNFTSDGEAAAAEREKLLGNGKRQPHISTPTTHYPKNTSGDTWTHTGSCLDTTNDAIEPAEGPIPNSPIITFSSDIDKDKDQLSPMANFNNFYNAPPGFQNSSCTPATNCSTGTSCSALQPLNEFYDGERSEQEPPRRKGIYQNQKSPDRTYSFPKKSKMNLKYQNFRNVKSLNTDYSTTRLSQEMNNWTRNSSVKLGSQQMKSPISPIHGAISDGENLSYVCNRALAANAHAQISASKSTTPTSPTHHTQNHNKKVLKMMHKNKIHNHHSHSKNHLQAPGSRSKSKNLDSDNKSETSSGSHNQLYKSNNKAWKMKANNMFIDTLKRPGDHHGCVGGNRQSSGPIKF